MDLTLRAFRNRLKRELPRWRAEGLVDARTEDALVARYHLNEEGISVAATTIFTLGALLIGAGVISFVAWNWESMSRPLKLLVLCSALVAAHGVGFWMWRIGGVIPRLGHALTMLGTLIFGASIGLVAQMYHIHADPSGVWGVWAIGAAAAAWVYRSGPNGAVGAVVACIWGCTFLIEHESRTGFVPYVATVPFFALLFVHPSRPLFGLTSIGFVILAAIATVIGFGSDGGFGFVLSTLSCAAGLLAFSLLPAYEREARTLGVLAVAFIAYLCSFHEIAEEFAVEPDQVESLAWLAYVAPLLAGAGLLTVRYQRGLRQRPVTICALACILLVFAGLATDNEILAAIAANLALAALAITLISTAARTLQRAPFWFGSLLAGLVILSRFFEFDTELWLKALVFLGCGVAVILFGIAFERRLRHVG